MIYQYVDTDVFLDHLTLDGFTPRRDFVIWALRVASGRVNRHCKRVFTPYGPELHRYDAGPSNVLDVDDLLADTAITITLGSTPLTLNTDYQLLPYTFTPLRPHYNQVRLLDPTTGLGLPWNTAALAAKRPPTGDIAILATRGWGQTVPDEVQQATEMIAARLLVMNDLKYGPGGGNPVVGESSTPGLIDTTLVDLLWPFVRDVPKGQEA